MRFSSFGSTLVVLLLFANRGFSQTKAFFDANGKQSSESAAYYYRECTGSGENCKAFYLTGKPFFDGKLVLAHPTDESLNTYQGSCTWFYKNGKKQSVRNFDEKGREDGISTYYYESGKISRVFKFEKGELSDGMFDEHDENGIVNRVFDEDFSSNKHDWDLYKSDKSKAEISGGSLLLVSDQNLGTSRMISIPSEGDSYSFEMSLRNHEYGKGKSGMIFGYKDWQNYWFFLFQKGYITIGSVKEGVISKNADAYFSSPIYNAPPNVTLKVLSNGSKMIFSVNGEVQFSTPFSALPGRYYGPVISGKGKLNVDQMQFKVLDVAPSNKKERVDSHREEDWKGTGSGFFIHESGLIATNHHVVDDTKAIEISYSDNNVTRKAMAKVVVSDKENDLALLKIEDPDFKKLPSLKYGFKSLVATNVGASVFSIGFPLYSILGSEPKFSDGKISSKTGYKNSMNSFQTTVAIQPGNSGSPLFNDKGELIGIVNAIVQEADNVSYAIKVSYLQNLIELLPESIDLPSSSLAPTLSLEEKIKVLTPYVVLIKVR